jgi:hypothetical protein
MNFLKRFPWYVWVILGLVLLLVVEGFTGTLGSRKLYNMVLDQLRTDQSRVVTTLEENMATYEQEIQTLQKQLETVKAKQAVVQAETVRLKGIINEKDKEILKLWKEREIMVVSSDPDILVNDLVKMGFSSTHKSIRRPSGSGP